MMLSVVKTPLDVTANPREPFCNSCSSVLPSIIVGPTVEVILIFGAVKSLVQFATMFVLLFPETNRLPEAEPTSAR